MHTKFAKAIMATKVASVSEERLETLSKIASNRFISESIPLNDTIAKIAQDEDLNSHAVERVCEMANLQTHAALLPAEPEKRASFAFPLADSKKVAGMICIKPPSGPLMPQEFARPPCGPAASSGPSMAELFGTSGCAHDGFKIPEKKSIIVMIQKKAAEKSRMHDKLLKEAMLAETAELEAHKTIKQAVLQGESLDDIHQSACQAGLGGISGEVLEKTAGILQGELVKCAFEAPEELIDRSVPVRIINGRNPIMASLDLLKQYRDNTYQIREGLMGLEQDISVLKQRLKELE